MTKCDAVFRIICLFHNMISRTLNQRVTGNIRSAIEPAVNTDTVNADVLQEFSAMKWSFMSLSAQRLTLC